MELFKIILLCILIVHNSHSHNFENIINDDILKILVPTVKSTNLKCRNHSIFYTEELKKKRLWAAKMFDASSKFPTGVLVGSNTDFGNYDECVRVKMPIYNENVMGKHCMVKFHIDPPDLEKSNYHKFYNDDEYMNASVWDMILPFSKDPVRRPRNEFYYSYCIPSSCNHQDLEASLKEITESFSSFSNITVTASINPLNCQRNDIGLGTADIIFISFVSIVAVIASIATFYDCLTDDHKKQAILMAFSLRANIKKLGTINDENKDLHCIHGIKVVTLLFIILGHRIMFDIGSPSLNHVRTELNEENRIDVTFKWSNCSRHILYYIRILACYLMMTELGNTNKRINFIWIYLHRLIRLTPSYAVIIAFYCTVFVKIGSGPFWFEWVQVEQERCLTSWWANLLYINNYVNKDNICMFQSWYLACDVHFFLMVPIIIWILRKNPIPGIATLSVLVILLAFILSVTVNILKEQPILILNTQFLRDPVVNSTFQDIYIPSHLRAIPFLIGMIAGYVKYQIKIKNYKIPNYIVYTSWTVSIILGHSVIYSAIVFYGPEDQYDPLIAAIYAGLHHIIWGVCMSWAIIAISEGRGAWFKPLFTWKPFIIMSRLTYTAFLCHGAVQIYTAASLRNGVFWSEFNLFYKVASDVFMTYFFGFLLSMLWEMPIINLEKFLLKTPSYKNKCHRYSENEICPIPIFKQLCDNCQYLSFILY